MFVSVCEVGRCVWASAPQATEGAAYEQALRHSDAAHGDDGCFAVHDEGEARDAQERRREAVQRWTAERGDAWVRPRRRPRASLQDRGRRAWDLLRREWGDAVADALWRGEPLYLLAINGKLYRVGWDDRGSQLADMTRARSLCVGIPREYPTADQLLAILEHLRANPANVERLANPMPL